MSSSLTDIQAVAGNPSTPKNDGTAPLDSIHFCAILSSSLVLIPGSIASPAVLRANAEIFPASRIILISSRDFNFIFKFRLSIIFY